MNFLKTFIEFLFSFLFYLLDIDGLFGNEDEETLAFVLTFVIDKQSSKAFSLIVMLEERIVTCFNDLHEINANESISVTNDGISICVSELQLPKDIAYIFLIDEERETFLSEVHLKKASSSILTTEFGIVTFSKDAHSINEPLQISMTEEGMFPFQVA